MTQFSVGWPGVLVSGSLERSSARAGTASVAASASVPTVRPPIIWARIPLERLEDKPFSIRVKRTPLVARDAPAPGRVIARLLSARAWEATPGQGAPGGFRVAWPLRRNPSPTNTHEDRSLALNGLPPFRSGQKLLTLRPHVQPPLGPSGSPGGYDADHSGLRPARTGGQGRESGLHCGE